MPDFVTVLTEDHRRVEQLFEQFESTGDPAVAKQIFEELSVHTIIEEELLYGLYSAKVDNVGAAEARTEHQESKDLILELESMEPGSDEYTATMTRLKESVQHHVQEEESEMFPKILKTLPDTAAILGNDLVTRKADVQARVRGESSRMEASTTNQKPVASPEPGW